MKSQIVQVPAIRQPITRSPGFAKKQLADFKLDVMGLCEFGCRYCSSNVGNYLRINRAPFARMTEEQLGEHKLPAENPELTFHWPDVLENLEAQLAGHQNHDFGEGQVLVYSMLTDGFSPGLVKNGTTKRALELVLEHTRFRIRILTKNAIVGQERWIRFFHRHPGRFVVGLSIGSLDDRWAKRVEKFTPPPSKRIAAIRRLQDSGIPTYGMLCPVFPDMLVGEGLEELLEQIRPSILEQIWAEPFNDRQNWQHVRGGYSPDSAGYRWMTDVYSQHQKDLWSHYAADLYARLHEKAQREGWSDKLIYLLYETDIVESDAGRFQGLEGVLLQSKPGPEGLSRNPYMAALQQEVFESGER